MSLLKQSPFSVLAHLPRLTVGLWIACAASAAWGQTHPTEIHTRIVQTSPGANQRVALTLDACSGAIDDDLVQFLIRNRIPATLFATKKWLDKNPQGTALLKKHLDLFDIEDHGENHIPAVIGVGRKVYGIPGEPDMLHLRKEVLEGAKAIEAATGVPPHWYRGATAEYDQAAADEIRRMGYKIAGFSVNADAGATLKKADIIARLHRVQGGDVIIAHMNKPASDTAEGLAVGLLDILRRGLVFVRLDEVELVEVK
jgi:peptidoglycan/xylan/chitin deacetylase (PgdA/CDA1 family)